jgi:branched-chain amino acid transport system substrate-binding protein
VCKWFGQCEWFGREENAMRDPGQTMTVERRTFLKTAGAAATATLGFPAVLRAQSPTVKLGAIHPVTGPLAEIGQACRLGAQMAADAVNTAGGVKSMGGARIELVLGDTQTKPDVAVAETQRVISAGAVAITGPFHSGHAMAMVPIARQPTSSR